MKKFIFFALAAIFVFSLALFGCGGEETTTAATPPTTQPTTQPTTSATTPVPTDARLPNLGDIAKPEGGKEGGRLRLIGGANIMNIGNPDEIDNPGDAGYGFVSTEGLVRFDSAGTLEPWLAEKWKIADDGSSVTFYLRKGIKFQDDTPFNAQAVKVNIDIMINTIAWGNMKSVESCEVIDDYTVKLNFKGGKFDWVVMNSLGGMGKNMMFSPTFLQNNTAEYKRSHVVGTGPYKLVEYERDMHLKYDRFDDYWRGKPYLEGIDYIIIPDPTTQLLSFKAGEVASVGIQTKDAADMIASGYEVKEVTNFIWNLAMIPDSNNPESPFHDIRVRQAFEYAIDKESMVAGLSFGYGVVSNQPFIEGQACYNPDTVGYPYNPTRAKELLTEAGYPTGFVTKVLMVDSMPLDWITVVQDMEKEVGIILEFDRVSLPQFGFQVGGAPGAGWEGLAVGICFAGSAQDPANSLMNGPLSRNTTWLSNWEPPELIDLADKASCELDFDKRMAMYQEISKKMTDDYAQWCFLDWSPGLYSVSPKVKGADFEHSSYSYAFAWLE